jgi:hypothetical protein
VGLTVVVDLAGRLARRADGVGVPTGTGSVGGGLPTCVVVMSGADAPRRRGARVGECGRETALLGDGGQVGRRHETECGTPGPEREPS